MLFAVARVAVLGLAGLWCIGTPDAAVPAETSSDPDRTAIAVEALSRLKGVDLETNPAVKSAVLKVLEQVKGTPHLVEIVRDFNLKEQDGALLQFASANPGTSGGVEAIQLLLAHKNPALLNTALAGTNAVPIIQALGYAADRESVPMLAPIVNDDSRPVAVRKEAVRALAQIHEG